jgi:hypothetical protein
MTGNDLVVQEQYESGFERDLHDNMDRVDRRDKRGSVVTDATTQKYREGFDKIWPNQEVK